MNRNEIEIVKNLTKEYNMLCKSNTRGLGQFIIKYCNSYKAPLKHYMPEVYEMALEVLVRFDTRNITPKMEFDIGSALLRAKRGA